MSCRDRAEAFARHLHSRLRSLDSENETSANESSWLAAHEASVAVSHQPRHSSDSDLYINFGLLDSPGSPEEEATETELSTLINNKDNLALARCESCHCPKNPNAAHSHDSDSSDGPYFDTESEGNQKAAQAYVNGIAELPEDDTGQDAPVENHVHESPPRPPPPSDIPYENHVDESPVTSEGTGPPLSCTDESTLSLRDEDYPSLEYSSTFQDLPQLENQEAPLEDSEVEANGVCPADEVETYSSSLNVDRDLTIECPLANVQVTKCDTPEEKEESPKESHAFLEIGSAEDEDDLDKEERTPRVRRCSSLKTGKTPPGTPGRKKIVRFADVLGLDLADVRTFLDEIPKVPTSAYDDLVDADLSASLSGSSGVAPHQKSAFKPEKILFPLFQQPGGQPNFLDRVRETSVCLENAVVSDPVDLSVKGTVRVRNLDFNKSVQIRYTLDAWKSYADMQASYVDNSCDGFSDKFSFLLYAHTLTEGQKLELAVRFHCKGCQYWDNNHGANYCFQCLPASNAAYLSNGTYDDHWGASFY